MNLRRALFQVHLWTGLPIAAVTRLHFGRGYGLFVKVLWAVLGLVPCALAITGVMVWWSRRNKGVSVRG